MSVTSHYQGYIFTKAQTTIIITRSLKVLRAISAVTHILLCTTKEFPLPISCFAGSPQFRKLFFEEPAISIRRKKRMLGTHFMSNTKAFTKLTAFIYTTSEKSIAMTIKHSLPTTRALQMKAAPAKTPGSTTKCTKTMLSLNEDCLLLRRGQFLVLQEKSQQDFSASALACPISHFNLKPCTTVRGKHFQRSRKMRRRNAVSHLPADQTKDILNACFRTLQLTV